MVLVPNAEALDWGLVQSRRFCPVGEAEDCASAASGLTNEDESNSRNSFQGDSGTLP